MTGIIVTSIILLLSFHPNHYHCYSHAWSFQSSTTNTSPPKQVKHAKERRQFISELATLSTISTLSSSPQNSIASTLEEGYENQNQEKNIIFSSGYGKEEYTNSITASRDTNISPKEVYDSIKSSYIYYPIEQLKKKGNNRTPRAFDVGAGAGELYIMYLE